MFIPSLLFTICLFYSHTVKIGINNGLILLFDQVIPALYPFILLSTYIKKRFTSSNSYLLLGISFLSGYPIGAKVAAEHSFSDIPLSNQNLLLICNNPSLPYMISYIGIGCFGHAKYGIMIYCCIIIGNIITVFIKEMLSTFRFSHKKKEEIMTICNIKETTIESLFHDCFYVLLNISNYILIFSVCAAFVNSIRWIPEYLRYIFIGILEITTGAQLIYQLNIITSIKLILITGIISFGGLSVFFQTHAMIKNKQVSIKKYMTDKAISSIIAMSVMYGFTHLLNLI